MVAVRQLVRTPSAEGVLVAGGLLTAFAVGYWSQEHARYALVLTVLPLLIALVCRPQLPLVLGVAALPLQLDVIGGSVHLTLADVLLTMAVLGSLPALLLVTDWRDRVAGSGPLLVAVAPFAVWLVAVALHHGSLSNLLKTGQYYQLFLLPLLLGAWVLQRRDARRALLGFVLASLVLAVLWTATGGNFAFGGNKNPTGQFIADAILVALALAPTWTWRLATLAPLVVGLGFTQSRGAVLAAGVGVIVVLALRGLGSWRRTLAAIVPLGLIVVIAYQALPENVAARTTDFSSGADSATLTAAQYSVKIRETYREQGWQLIRDHPFVGVGPGNYVTGTPGTDSYTIDPHDLIIRTAGDVGYPGLAGFGLLVGASALVAIRRIKVNPYAALAVGVQAALITHGFVDVYWVRGTPVLGWLLIGMAVNRRLDEVSSA